HLVQRHCTFRQPRPDEHRFSGSEGWQRDFRPLAHYLSIETQLRGGGYGKLDLRVDHSVQVTTRDQPSALGIDSDACLVWRVSVVSAVAQIDGQRINT